MHERELLRWLDAHHYTSLVRSHSVYFRRVLEKSMNTTRQPLLVVGDYGTPGKHVSPLMCGAYAFAAQSLGLTTEIVMQEIKERTESADYAVIEALTKLPPSSRIALSLSNRLGNLGPVGKSYRRFMRERKHRFVSTSGVGGLDSEHFYSVTQALNINYLKLKREAQRLTRILDGAREVRVTSPGGTDLTIGITGQQAIPIDGDYTGRNYGGNIPAGEVYIAPQGEKVEGTVVIDASSRIDAATLLIKKPITLTITKGMITKIEGDREARLLKGGLDKAMLRAKVPSNVRQIGELGIGLNPRLDVVGAMILDEKAHGTAHVAIGSNYWFGGTNFTLIHLDQVFYQPTLYVDGREVKLPKKKDLI